MGVEGAERNGNGTANFFHAHLREQRGLRGKRGNKSVIKEALVNRLGRNTLYCEGEARQAIVGRAGGRFPVTPRICTAGRVLKKEYRSARNSSK